MAVSTEHISIINSSYKIPKGMGVLQLAILKNEGFVYIEQPEKKDIWRFNIVNSTKTPLEFFDLPEFASITALDWNPKHSKLFEANRKSSDQWFELMTTCEQLELLKSKFSTDLDKGNMKQVIMKAFSEAQIEIKLQGNESATFLP